MVVKTRKQPIPPCQRHDDKRLRVKHKKKPSETGEIQVF
jgi:hypothetical protein